MTYIQELSSLCTHLTFSKVHSRQKEKSSDSPVGKQKLAPNKYIPWQKTYLPRKGSKPLKKAAAIDGVHETSNTCEDDDTLEPYADEPIADEEWLKRYRKEHEEKRRLEEDLTKCLENRVRVSGW